MFDSTLIPVRRALVSVSDKTGLIDLGRALDALGIDIISTGGSARALREAHIPVREVSDVTGFPEIMDGRVKTLHPTIHGGLLGRHQEDAAVMSEHGIEPIDLLIVNLYPFARTVADPEVDPAAAIENIDIGGPAMLRAAAKNQDRVLTVTDPDDYAPVIDALRQEGGTTQTMRQQHAARAFAHTARYDGMISDWLSRQTEADDAQPFSPRLHLGLNRASNLRYGENPHQNAALYVEPDAADSGTVATARVLAGKPLSYNNLADADAALECVKAFRDTPACVVVKHANPCGVALGDDLEEAYQRAFACDSTSAFGGIIAFNQTLDAATARRILANQFVEVVLAPQVDDAACAVFADKPNVRVLATGNWPQKPPITRNYKRIAGGLLVQDTDRDTLLVDDLQVVTQRIPTAAELRDLLFAWHVAMYVKSNAIVYARDSRTVGIGAGQMSRVDSARIAAIKAADAGLAIDGGAMASDAFFPFRDGVDAGFEAGAQLVIQPGGSIRDEEVIAAANEHGMAMVFTGTRHFRH